MSKKLENAFCMKEKKLWRRSVLSSKLSFTNSTSVSSLNSMKSVRDGKNSRPRSMIDLRICVEETRTHWNLSCSHKGCSLSLS